MLYYSLIYFSKFHTTFSKLIFQSLSLSKFQVEPVLELVENLMIDVTKTDIKFFSDRLMMDDELWPTLVNLGKKCIPADCSPLGILFRIF